MRKKLITAAAAVLALAVGSYWLTPGVWVRPLIALDRKSNGVTSQTLTADGRSFSYWEGGDGETVVMLHGFGGNKDHWTHFAGDLRKGYRVISLDLPGFGDSPGSTADRFDLQSQTERVLRFLEAKRLSKVHLIGNSMGAHLAARVARARPEAVQSLALLEPHGLPPQGPTEFDAIRQRGEIPLVVSNEREFERMVNLLFVKRPWVPQPVYAFLRADAIARSPMNRHIWNESHGPDASALESVLPAIKAPALVVWGDSNRVFHVNGVKTIERSLPRATSVVLAECGHLPMMERPKETAAAYRNFLARL
jgi:pimeloyl-ACP methyl ester carboxylesterase